MKKYLLPALGVIIGGAAGYAYSRYVGCANGCPMTSNPIFMAAYGALLGLFTLQSIGEIVGKVRNAKKIESTRHEKTS